MAEFLHKIAQVLLLLYCLTPIESKLDFTEKELAIVNATSGGTPCLAVWISQHCLITAASCFDELGKRNFTKNPDIDVIITTWRNYNYSQKADRGKYEKKIYKGEAIVHPHYRRKGRMTFAYDLAVVRVKKSLLMRVWKKFTGNKKNKTINLCSRDSEDDTNSWRLGVYTEPSRRSREYHQSWRSDRRYYQTSVTESKPWNFAVTGRPEVDHRGKTGNAGKTEQVVYIDERKQFTTNLEPRVVVDVPIGGPVFDIQKSCVRGIVNVVGERNHIVYITSTLVYPVEDWIRKTGQYLKTAKFIRKRDNIYGPEKKFWKKKKIVLDPFEQQQQPGNEQPVINEPEPGNPLSSGDLNQLDYDGRIRLEEHDRRSKF